MDVWIICAIHDWMYRDPAARARRDKDIADIILLINAAVWICAKSKPVLRELRMYRATSYFNAVHDGGDKAFWGDGKGAPQP